MKYRLSNMRIILMIFIPLVTTLGLTIGALQSHVPLAIFATVLISGLSWYCYMHVPYEFESINSDTLVFRSLARITTMHISSITEVDARLWNKGFIKIQSSQGSVSLFREMPGIAILIDAVKRGNENANIRGGK